MVSSENEAMEELQFERLVRENRLMIYSIINSVVYDGIRSDYRVSYEDLFQEGCIALYNACLTYNAGGDAKFSTYAYVIIRRRIIHKYREYVRPLQHESCSYDAAREMDYLSYCSGDLNMHGGRNEAYELASEFANTLCGLDFEIVRLRKQKISYKEIAELINMTPKQIDNRLCAIRRKYRAYLKKRKEIS